MLQAAISKRSSKLCWHQQNSCLSRQGSTHVCETGGDTLCGNAASFWQTLVPVTAIKKVESLRLKNLESLERDLKCHPYQLRDTAGSPLSPGGTYSTAP